MLLREEPAIETWVSPEEYRSKECQRVSDTDFEKSHQSSVLIIGHTSFASTARHIVWLIFNQSKF